MKKVIFVVVVFSFLFAQALKATVTALEMSYVDSAIEFLCLKLERRALNNEPVTKEALDEKMAMLEMTQRYIDLRDMHPFISKRVGIGSIRVYNEVMKVKMLAALDYDTRNTPLFITKINPPDEKSKDSTKRR